MSGHTSWKSCLRDCSRLIGIDGPVGDGYESRRVLCGAGSDLAAGDIQIRRSSADVRDRGMADFAGILSATAFTGWGSSARVVSTPIARITAVGRSTVPVAPPDLSTTVSTVPLGEEGEEPCQRTNRWTADAAGGSGTLITDALARFTA